MSLLLGVNVDHVATLRQARYALLPDSKNAEPSPLVACYDAKEGGADSITIHVRADRRHMQTADAFLIKEKSSLPLNLEMGVTDEMTRLALEILPTFACLVPETREEVTTEGGLDVITKRKEVGACIRVLQKEKIKVSLFIDPDSAQVRCAAELGAEMIELHTGAFANSTNAADDERELEKLIQAADLAHSIGLQVNAGHGINYQNIKTLFTVPYLKELNIGHSIVSRAMRVGFSQAVKDMKLLMSAYPL